MVKFKELREKRMQNYNEEWVKDKIKKGISADDFMKEIGILEDNHVINRPKYMTLYMFFSNLT